MPSYRVKVDGKTVWKGEGDDLKAIPAELRERPAEGEPARHLFQEDANGKDVLIGVQISAADEAANATAEEG